MAFRVEDRVQADQPHIYAVRPRSSKSGKLPRASAWPWKVELRSKLFKKGKIWVGTFKTKEKAKKACDAALHVLGRLPCHYPDLPSGHFREIGERPQGEADLKKLVKSWAKEYADRPLPIMAATPTVVTSADSAPQLDHHALRNFQADPTVRNVCEVGSAHNSATYPISSPRVPASSSSSPPCKEWLEEFLMAEDPEDRSLEDSDDYKKILGIFQACCEPPAREAGVGSDVAIDSANKDPSLEDSNEYKQIYNKLQACCETLAREVRVGSADAAIGSANEEAAKEFSGSIDSPLASVPRLEAHTRRHQPEFARIEGADNVDYLERADMCKSTED